MEKSIKASLAEGSKPSRNLSRPYLGPTCTKVKQPMATKIQNCLQVNMFDAKRTRWSSFEGGLVSGGRPASTAGNITVAGPLQPFPRHPTHCPDGSSPEIGQEKPRLGKLARRIFLSNLTWIGRNTLESDGQPKSKKCRPFDWWTKQVWRGEGFLEEYLLVWKCTKLMQMFYYCCPR